jgi:hypothetical protein
MNKVKKLPLPVVVTALVLAGCGPAASGSLGAVPSGTATRTPARTDSAPSTSHPATSHPATSHPATTPPAPASATSSAPPPTPAASDCSRETVLGGTFMVCPGSAPVGATVTISSNTLCQAGPGSEPTLVFLGPAAFIGSGGGGNEVPVTKAGAGFTATYRIPATYTKGGNKNPQLPVTPGSGYSFATYPAGACDTAFTVTP